MQFHLHCINIQTYDYFDYFLPIVELVLVLCFSVIDY